MTIVNTNTLKAGKHTCGSERSLHAGLRRNSIHTRSRERQCTMHGARRGVNPTIPMRSSCTQGCQQRAHVTRLLHRSHRRHVVASRHVSLRLRMCCYLCLCATKIAISYA